jgi:hypothetical protein
MRRSIAAEGLVAELETVLVTAGGCRRCRGWIMGRRLSRSNRRSSKCCLNGG